MPRFAHLSPCQHYATRGRMGAQRVATRFQGCQFPLHLQFRGAESTDVALDDPGIGALDPRNEGVIYPWCHIGHPGPRMRFEIRPRGVGVNKSVLTLMTDSDQ